MKKIIPLFLIATLCWQRGFAENPRWKIVDETPIPPHANLDVRWEAPTKTIPHKIRIYRLLPNKFSPAVISNLMTLCSFEKKDETGGDTNEMVCFQNSDASRKLSISFATGSIRYETPEWRSGPTNLAKDVPDMSQLPELATNFVKQMDIPLSVVTGFFQTDIFNFSQVGTIYDTGATTVTNIEFRSVKFRRSVDGIPFVGGDGGDFDVGEYAKISKISIDWHTLKLDKTYPAVSKRTVMNFLRQGKAFQGLLPMSIGEIDWPTIKKVTITKALPCYFAGNTDLLYPFLVLFTTIDTGRGNVDVQIECPLIDETKL